MARHSGFSWEVAMFADIYRNKNIFVTGLTGFKGSWLCAWLISMGAQVTGYSLGVPTRPANFDALGLDQKMHNIEGDVRDGEKLAQALKQAQPDFVFHLAAQALVRDSYADPVTTFQTNMMGVLNILEAGRHCESIKAMVIITSDKCYRNDEWVWGYRETDRLGGSDPYSASKGCAEIIAHSYFDSFYKQGAACATVRAGNVIGGGDWANDRIVPDCARAWASGKPALIRSPGATRPWQHVLEPLSGYLWLGAILHDNDYGCGFSPRGQAYNFGPPADVNNPVSELVASLARFWPGFTSVSDPDGCGAKKECTLLKLCCDKALAHLDWKATLNFEETVRYTAEWYARYYATGATPDMWDFTQGQIAAYANAAQNRGLKWTN